MENNIYLSENEILISISSIESHFNYNKRFLKLQNTS